MTPSDPTRAPVPRAVSLDREMPVRNKKAPPQPDSISSSSSDLPTPPDGGWGWVVVFASFMIHVIADGITYSFGIFVVELMETFNAGRGSVSLIPSILVGVTLGAGPIASSLVNKYGCRIVTIAGAVLAAIGLALSALTPNIAVLYFTIGICTGLGFGLIYLPAIVSVSMYFEKRRAFATGIAVCGSGLGTFIMAPVTRGLIDEFKWTGAILITAGFVLINILFGALFRPLEKSDDNDPVIVEEEREVLTANASFAVPAPELHLNGEAIRPLAIQMGLGDDKYSNVARVAFSHPVIPSAPPEIRRQSLKFGSFSRIYEKQHSNPHHHSHHHLHHHRSGVMFRKDILYGGSLYNIPEYKSDPERYSKRIAKLQVEEDVRSLAEEEETEGSKACGCVGREASKAFYEMMDLSLLKDYVFIMFAISNFLTSIGFNVPYVYTVDRAESIGIDKEDASFLLSVIGIANTLGRIVLGYISDKPWLNRLYLYNSALAVCGITMGLSNFCNDYTSQAVYCAVFGITSGAYVGLTSVVLVDLLGLDKLTNAFGLLLLFQGIASVLGPPIIGWLRDAFGNYENGFYFAGTMVFLSGVMLFGIPWLQRKTKETRTEQNNRV